MGGKRTRGNGEGDVYPRRNKEGKIIGYRGAYWVQTAKGTRRRYVSGKNKGETRAALTKAKADRDGGLVFEAGTLTSGSTCRAGSRIRSGTRCGRRRTPGTSRTPAGT